MKKLFVLAAATLMLTACGGNGGSKKAQFEGTLNTYSELVAGSNDQVFTIGGYVTAYYKGYQTGGIFIANGEETIQLYQYTLPEGADVGSFVVVTGGRSEYANGRVVELARTHKVDDQYVPFDDAALTVYDLDEYDIKSFGDFSAPVNYTFNKDEWASLTSSTTAADWTNKSGRVVEVTGTVKTVSSTDAAANNTVTITVDGVDVAVYLHKSNDAASDRELAVTLTEGDSVTVKGTVGSYKGSTQIVCIQSLTKNA